MDNQNIQENPMVTHSPIDGVNIDMVTFLEQQAVLQFQKDMDLIKPSWKQDPQYEQKIEAWQRIIAFPNAIVNQLNDSDNQKLVGKWNSSDGVGVEDVTREDPNHNSSYDYVPIRK